MHLGATSFPNKAPCRVSLDVISGLMRIFSQLNDKFSIEYPAIAVIAVEPVVIYPFVKNAHGRGQRLNSSVNTTQNDPIVSFLCQTAANCYKSY